MLRVVPITEWFYDAGMLDLTEQEDANDTVMLKDNDQTLEELIVLGRAVVNSIPGGARERHLARLRYLEQLHELSKYRFMPLDDRDVDADLKIFRLKLHQRQPRKRPPWMAHGLRPGMPGWGAGGASGSRAGAEGAHGRGKNEQDGDGNGSGPAVGSAEWWAQYKKKQNQRRGSGSSGSSEYSEGGTRRKKKKRHGSKDSSRSSFYSEGGTRYTKDKSKQKYGPNGELLGPDGLTDEERRRLGLDGLGGADGRGGAGGGLNGEGGAGAGGRGGIGYGVGPDGRPLGPDGKPIGGVDGDGYGIDGDYDGVDGHGGRGGGGRGGRGGKGGLHGEGVDGLDDEDEPDVSGGLFRVKNDPRANEDSGRTLLPQPSAESVARSQARRGLDRRPKALDDFDDDDDSPGKAPDIPWSPMAGIDGRLAEEFRKAIAAAWAEVDQQMAQAQGTLHSRLEERVSAAVAGSSPPKAITSKERVSTAETGSSPLKPVIPKEKEDKEDREELDDEEVPGDPSPLRLNEEGDTTATDIDVSETTVLDASLRHRRRRYGARLQQRADAVVGRSRVRQRWSQRTETCRRSLESLTALTQSSAGLSAFAGHAGNELAAVVA